MKYLPIFISLIFFIGNSFSQTSGSLPPIGQGSISSTSKSKLSNVRPNKLKIAFVYVGPIGDGGWTWAHEQGRKALELEFGDRITTTYIENVPESADSELVFRELAERGNNLIIGTTFGYMEPMLKIASTYKNVKFEHANGYKSSSNLRAYDARTYEGAFLAGIVAGKMTKTNVLGFVASIPIPEIIRNINSFTLGAQSVNPQIKTKVIWVNEWYNPPKEAEAATALINYGADILFQNTDSAAVLQTAEKMKVRAFGWDSDMSPYSRTAHLGSAVINWGPYYIKATRDILEGKWTNLPSWWGVKEGVIDLVSLASDITIETKQIVASVKSGLRSGSFVIWKGPIVAQNGQTILPLNTVADDRFLGGMNFYVKGVDGRIPR